MKHTTISMTLNGRNYNCFTETDGRMHFAYMMVHNDKMEPIIFSCDFPDAAKSNKCFVAAGIRKFKKTAGVAVYIKAYSEIGQPIWVFYDSCDIKSKSVIIKEFDYNFNELK